MTENQGQSDQPGSANPPPPPPPPPPTTVTAVPWTDPYSYVEVRARQGERHERRDNR